jgi:hypothetical protein
MDHKNLQQMKKRPAKKTDRITRKWESTRLNILLLLLAHTRTQANAQLAIDASKRASAKERHSHAHTLPHAGIFA